MLSGIVLYIWDSHFKGGILNMSGTVRAKLQSIPKDDIDAKESLGNDVTEVQNQVDVVSANHTPSTSWNRNTTDSKLE